MNFEQLFGSTPDPFDQASKQEPTKTDQPKKLTMGNDSDRKAMWKAAGSKALENLYRTDPLVRSDLLSQVEASKLPDLLPKRESVVEYDEQGNIKGLKKSVIQGAYATGRDQLEVMRAIRKQSHRVHGITD